MRFTLMAILLSLQLFSYDERFTQEENRWIDENPVIDYVGDPAWLPFEGYDIQGNYTGIVPELLDLASERSPLTFRHLKTDSWDASLEAVKSAQVMMISQSQNSNAHTSLLFTKSFFKTPVVIVMQEGESYVSSLYQIREKKIGLTDNKTTTPILKKNYADISFFTYSNVEDGLNALALGEIDAFLCSLPLAGYKIAKMQLSNLRIVGKSEAEVELGFGVNSNYPVLHAILNKMITNRSEVDVQRVLSKWTRQEYVEKVDYTALYVTLAVFAFISLTGTLFYFRLKHESKARLDAQSTMLQQQSKMASMGEMMDAVAHQWKQPLNALSMYSDLFKSDFEEGKVDKAYVDDMLEGVQVQINHMISTLNEFRNFFRPTGDILDFNLSKAVESTLFLVKDEFMKNSISMDVDVDPTLALRGNENEFKHLILNIINNAKDAFNEHSLSGRLIKIIGTGDEERIYLSIQDNAGGIPEGVIDHIFEANVTTKEAGEGTGIGLYMSEQIIKKMGGRIAVVNVDDGACFNIEVKRSLSS